jgi:hypothetical protein
MKIIRWECGKYGVRIGSWYTGYKFLDKNAISWEHLMCFCKFDKYEECLSIKLKYKQNEIINSNKYKVL